MKHSSKADSVTLSSTDASNPDFGGQPVEHFRQVLEAARAAAPEGRDKLLILTHRGPDPDAIAACQGVRHLCAEAFGLEAMVATVGEINRAENLAMVRALGLEFATYERIDHDDYYGAVLVDTQPRFGHTVVPEDIPLLAVFDHHVPPSVDEDSDPLPEIPHRDVRLGIGASASILYEYLRDAGCELDTTTATALFCGIRYDTADLSRNSAPLDEEAYYATFRQSDREKITRINHPPLPQVYYSELHAALSEAKQHGALVLCLLGKISHPEFVAEMADFFLRMKGASWVVVGGAVEKEGEYVLSLRTDYAFGNAYPLMGRVLDGEGSFGGHGHIAGARIPLEDMGESSIASVERQLRKHALAILGTSDDGLPSQGRSLS
ncbi:MAG: nanoRNase/pAp phosphatase (c-di-AMP/oligoRNAs hydrolase) [Candidatus Paceibacteria bacterium]|jgi:nanoRNase/pAp phosphatase (c-di-AMP/oligoRNAs hydrolase)